MKNFFILIFSLILISLNPVLAKSRKKCLNEDFISWKTALAIIKSGAVSSVLQLHNLNVTLFLKDGSTLYTKEPSIDEVISVILECGDLCRDIPIATE